MNQHVVYFIGGPLDLSKKVFEGERPSHPYLLTGHMTPTEAPNGLDGMAVRYDRYEYAITGLPQPDPHERRRAFAAVYRGRADR